MQHWPITEQNIKIKFHNLFSSNKKTSYGEIPIACFTTFYFQANNNY